MIAKIYVAGPYTFGDCAQNVRNAFAAANTLADLGFAPFVPHYTHFWQMLFPRDKKFWLQLDFQFLACCDAVLRLPGKSDGADQEEALSGKLNIPVFYTIEEVSAHFKK